MENPPHNLLVEIKNKIQDNFSEEELKDLCFELNIDYDALQGEGKGGKTRELVKFAQRGGTLIELVEAASVKRRNIQWPVFANAITSRGQTLNIELLVNGIQLKQDTVIRLSNNKLRTIFRGELVLEISMHNATGNLLAPNSFKVALHTIEAITPVSEEFVKSFVTLADGSHLINLREPTITFPDEWDAIRAKLRTSFITPYVISDSAPFSVMLFTKFGRQSFPFTAPLPPPNNSLTSKSQ